MERSNQNSLNNFGQMAQTCFVRYKKTEGESYLSFNERPPNVWKCLLDGNTTKNDSRHIWGRCEAEGKDNEGNVAFLIDL